MELVSPLQFSVVQPTLYRGSYPREINLPFLKSLQLKKIISFVPEEITKEVDAVLVNFCEEHYIELIHIQSGKVKQKKEKKKKEDKSKVKRKQKQVPIEYSTVIECVKILINKNNYPCYMHGVSDNDIVISLVVACLRKFSFWSNIAIMNEFLVYNSSINIHERTFIESFNSEIIIENMDKKDIVNWIHSQSTSSSSTSMLPKIKFES
ncbi:hypothetical protein TPHA_0D04310 [Tetrapisispora phaffii CBS 4417]|uniref:Tyrosine-protein phosphatase domain-containing protein n=1 Tax=Tetrapisispora phaffii (strain ATCC 24235 / CBS 4417 / NBRC 1672 / NRRL Y-8282 / UCD 70-5) TaxID=1071381 RepID=G8BRZ0_TETPH|nr:hypothetical protein TPHA_0D04310 [Tetrapisispora phaffii CBS 4417]CCE63065.1 hypothetical protein TPHA_0D04310 [Tetrapisispora phaffii CBS 4417]